MAPPATRPLSIRDLDHTLGAHADADAPSTDEHDDGAGDDGYTNEYEYEYEEVSDGGESAGQAASRVRAPSHGHEFYTRPLARSAELPQRDDSALTPAPPLVQLPRVHNTPDRFAAVGARFAVDESQVNYGVKLYEEAQARRAAKQRALADALAASTPLSTQSFRPQLGPTAQSIVYADTDVVGRLAKLDAFVASKRERLRQAIEEEANEQCTFSPQVLRKSRKLVEARAPLVHKHARASEPALPAEPPADAFASMLERFNYYEAVRVRRLERAMREKEAAAAASFVGRPDIGEYARTLHAASADTSGSTAVEPGGSVFDRLYDEALRAKELRAARTIAAENARVEKLCQPKPAIHDIGDAQIRKAFLQHRSAKRSAASSVHDALYADAERQLVRAAKRARAAQLRAAEAHAQPKMDAKSKDLLRRRYGAAAVEHAFARVDRAATGALELEGVHAVFVRLGLCVRPQASRQARTREELAALRAAWPLVAPDGTVGLGALISFVQSLLQYDPIMRQDDEAETSSLQPASAQGGSEGEPEAAASHRSDGDGDGACDDDDGDDDDGDDDAGDDSKSLTQASLEIALARRRRQAAPPAPAALLPLLECLRTKLAYDRLHPARALLKAAKRGRHERHKSEARRSDDATAAAGGGDQGAASSDGGEPDSSDDDALLSGSVNASIDPACTFAPQMLLSERTAALEARALAALIVANPALSERPTRRHEVIAHRAHLARVRREARALMIQEQAAAECKFVPETHRYTPAPPPPGYVPPVPKRRGKIGGGGSAAAAAASAQEAVLSAKLTSEERELLQHGRFAPAIHAAPPAEVLAPKPLAATIKGFAESVSRQHAGNAQRERRRKAQAPLKDFVAAAPPPPPPARRRRRARAAAWDGSSVADSTCDSASITSDMSADPILFVMNVALGLGRSGSLGVRAGDDARVLAREFGALYRLDGGMVRQLEAAISAQLEAFLAQNYNDELVALHTSLQAARAARQQSMDASTARATGGHDEAYSYYSEDAENGAGGDGDGDGSDGNAAGITGRRLHAAADGMLHSDSISTLDEDALELDDEAGDGVPRVVLTLRGMAVEGSALQVHERFYGLAESAGCEIARRWVRIGPDGERQVVLQNATSLVPCGADAGCSFVYQCMPPGGRWTSTRPIGPIAALAPAAAELAIVGELVEGSVLRLAYRYSGGVEGASAVRWFGRPERDAPSNSILLGTGARLELDVHTVGQYIAAELTPVRAGDGVAGMAKLVASAQRVEPGLPRALQLELVPGAVRVGVPIAVTSRYFGGRSARVQQFRWFRIVADAEALLEVAATKDYVPVADDANHYLKLVWTPVRADGRMGEPVAVTTPTAVRK